MANWTQKAIECLHKNPNTEFTSREMAEWIFENYNKECEQKRKESLQDLSDNNKLISQINAQIDHSILKQSNNINTKKVPGKRGVCFFYSTNNETQEKEPFTNIISPTEHDLYPKLNQYLKKTLKIHNKRIDENKSKNNMGKKGNEWLHPDIVGVKNLSTNWDNTILEITKHTNDKLLELWSFEVKKEITMSNIRESFFQTVSNSSWANYGYLVAREINPKALQELCILSNLHGIGFIKLNYENPEKSRIEIPARENVNVDWNNIDRIFGQNSDFEKYIKSIRKFYLTGEIDDHDWD